MTRGRNLTRRTFVRAGGATALSFAAGSGLIPAYGQDTLGLDLPYQSSPMGLVSVKKGGTLRMGLADGSTTDKLDPVSYFNIFMQILGAGMVFDTLTQIAPDGSVQGELAESWEVSPDARAWTFRLKSGVSFHNGKSLTPEDVIASVRYHMDENNSSPVRILLKQIDAISRLDNRTVRFTLSAGNADWPYLLAANQLVIFPANDRKEAFRRGIGTGAYVLENFEPGVRAIGRRNSNDHRSDRGHFDSIELLSILDETEREKSLLSGEVDLINQVSVDHAAALGRNTRIRIVEVPGNTHSSLPMQANTNPYNDLNVRLALKYACDRQILVDRALNGFGSIGNDHPIGPATPFYAPPGEIGQRAYDPDKARYHLRRAGMSRLSVKLSVSDGVFRGAVALAEAYRETAAACGIDIAVDRQPTDGYWSNVWMKKPWVASYWSGRPIADMMLSLGYESGAPWNESRWSHKRFDKLLREARAELNQSRRSEMYREMQLILKDEGSSVIPTFNHHIFAVSDKLRHGSKISGLYDMDGGRLPERWWFG